MNAVRDNVATFTPAELAARWKVHINTIRSLIRDGKVQVIRVGAQPRIPKWWVEEYERNLEA